MEEIKMKLEELLEKLERKENEIGTFFEEQKRLYSYYSGELLNSDEFNYTQR